MRKGRFKTSELTLLAMLTAILFVQETLLSSIPNIQFSVLLIMVYAATLGIPKAMLVMTVHVLLDNIIWGSLNPLTACPMWLGWFILILIGFALRKTPLPAIVAGSVLGSIIYCLCFALFNYLFMDINIIAYLTADIIFEILMCCSSVVTVMFLYRPAEKLINMYYSKYVNKEE
ncbi:MAG: hypothetical protein J6A83_00260 [Clostridia bacterium]|nr:hypothetical protein [Clostridia bacterium]